MILLLAFHIILLHGLFLGDQFKFGCLERGTALQF